MIPNMNFLNSDEAHEEQAVTANDDVDQESTLSARSYQNESDTNVDSGMIVTQSQSSDACKSQSKQKQNDSEKEPTEGENLGSLDRIDSLDTFSECYNSLSNDSDGEEKIENRILNINNISSAEGSIKPITKSQPPNTTRNQTQSQTKTVQKCNFTGSSAFTTIYKRNYGNSDSRVSSNSRRPMIRLGHGGTLSDLNQIPRLDLSQSNLNMLSNSVYMKNNADSNNQEILYSPGSDHTNDLIDNETQSQTYMGGASSTLWAHDLDNYRGYLNYCNSTTSLGSSVGSLISGECATSMLSGSFSERKIEGQILSTRRPELRRKNKYSHVSSRFLFYGDDETTRYNKGRKDAQQKRSSLVENPEPDDVINSRGRAISSRRRGFSQDSLNSHRSQNNKTYDIDGRMRLINYHNFINRPNLNGNNQNRSSSSQTETDNKDNRDCQELEDYVLLLPEQDYGGEDGNGFNDDFNQDATPLSKFGNNESENTNSIEIHTPISARSETTPEDQHDRTSNEYEKVSNADDNPFSFSAGKTDGVVHGNNLNVNSNTSILTDSSRAPLRLNLRKLRSSSDLNSSLNSIGSSKLTLNIPSIHGDNSLLSQSLVSSLRSDSDENDSLNHPASNFLFMENEGPVNSNSVQAISNLSQRLRQKRTGSPQLQTSPRTNSNPPAANSADTNAAVGVAFSGAQAAAESSNNTGLSLSLRKSLKAPLDTGLSRRTGSPRDVVSSPVTVASSSTPSDVTRDLNMTPRANLESDDIVVGAAVSNSSTKPIIRDGSSSAAGLNVMGPVPTVITSNSGSNTNQKTVTTTVSHTNTIQTQQTQSSSSSATHLQYAVSPKLLKDPKEHSFKRKELQYDNDMKMLDKADKKRRSEFGQITGVGGVGVGSDANVNPNKLALTSLGVSGNYTSNKQDVSSLAAAAVAAAASQALNDDNNKLGPGPGNSNSQNFSTMSFNQLRQSQQARQSQNLRQSQNDINGVAQASQQLSPKQDRPRMSINTDEKIVKTLLEDAESSVARTPTPKYESWKGLGNEFLSTLKSWTFIGTSKTSSNSNTTTSKANQKPQIRSSSTIYIDASDTGFVRNYNSAYATVVESQDSEDNGQNDNLNNEQQNYFQDSDAVNYPSQKSAFAGIMGSPIQSSTNTMGKTSSSSSARTGSPIINKKSINSADSSNLSNRRSGEQENVAEASSRSNVTNEVDTNGVTTGQTRFSSTQNTGQAAAHDPYQSAGPRNNSSVFEPNLYSFGRPKPHQVRLSNSNKVVVAPPITKLRLDNLNTGPPSGTSAINQTQVTRRSYPSKHDVFAQKRDFKASTTTATPRSGQDKGKGSSSLSTSKQQQQYNDPNIINLKAHNKYAELQNLKGTFIAKQSSPFRGRDGAENFDEILHEKHEKKNLNENNRDSWDQAVTEQEMEELDRLNRSTPRTQVKTETGNLEARPIINTSSSTNSKSGVKLEDSDNTTVKVTNTSPGSGLNDNANSNSDHDNWKIQMSATDRLLESYEGIISLDQAEIYVEVAKRCVRNPEILSIAKDSPRFQEAIRREGLEWHEIRDEQNLLYKTKLLTDVFLERNRINEEIKPKIDIVKHKFNNFVENLNQKEAKFVQHETRRQSNLNRYRENLIAQKLKTKDKIERQIEKERNRRVKELQRQKQWQERCLIKREQQHASFHLSQEKEKTRIKTYLKNIHNDDRRIQLLHRNKVKHLSQMQKVYKLRDEERRLRYQNLQFDRLREADEKEKKNDEKMEKSQQHLEALWGELRMVKHAQDEVLRQRQHHILRLERKLEYYNYCKYEESQVDRLQKELQKELAESVQHQRKDWDRKKKVLESKLGVDEKLRILKSLDGPGPAAYDGHIVKDNTGSNCASKKRGGSFDRAKKSAKCFDGGTNGQEFPPAPGPATYYNPDSIYQAGIQGISPETSQGVRTMSPRGGVIKMKNKLLDENIKKDDFYAKLKTYKSSNDPNLHFMNESHRKWRREYLQKRIYSPTNGTFNFYTDDISCDSPTHGEKNNLPMSRLATQFDKRALANLPGWARRAEIQRKNADKKNSPRGNTNNSPGSHKHHIRSHSALAELGLEHSSNAIAAHRRARSHSPQRTFGGPVVEPHHWLHTKPKKTIEVLEDFDILCAKYESRLQDGLFQGFGEFLNQDEEVREKKSKATSNASGPGGAALTANSKSMYSDYSNSDTSDGSRSPSRRSQQSEVNSRSPSDHDVNDNVNEQQQSPRSENESIKSQNKHHYTTGKHYPKGSPLFLPTQRKNVNETVRQHYGTYQKIMERILHRNKSGDNIADNYDPGQQIKSKNEPASKAIDESSSRQSSVINVNHNDESDNSNNSNNVAKIPAGESIATALSEFDNIPDKLKSAKQKLDHINEEQIKFQKKSTTTNKSRSRSPSPLDDAIRTQIQEKVNVNNLIVNTKFNSNTNRNESHSQSQTQSLDKVLHLMGVGDGQISGPVIDRKKLLAEELKKEKQALQDRQKAESERRIKAVMKAKQRLISASKYSESESDNDKLSKDKKNVKTKSQSRPDGNITSSTNYNITDIKSKKQLTNLKSSISASTESQVSQIINGVVRGGTTSQTTQGSRLSSRENLSNQSDHSSMRSLDFGNESIVERQAARQKILLREMMQKQQRVKMRLSEMPESKELLQSYPGYTKEGHLKRDVGATGKVQDYFIENKKQIIDYYGKKVNQGKTMEQKYKEKIEKQAQLRKQQEEETRRIKGESERKRTSLFGKNTNSLRKPRPGPITTESLSTVQENTSSNIDNNKKPQQSSSNSTTVASINTIGLKDQSQSTNLKPGAKVNLSKKTVSSNTVTPRTKHIKEHIAKHKAISTTTVTTAGNQQDNVKDSVVTTDSVTPNLKFSSMSPITAKDKLRNDGKNNISLRTGSPRQDTSDTNHDLSNNNQNLTMVNHIQLSQLSNLSRASQARTGSPRDNQGTNSNILTTVTTSNAKSSSSAGKPQTVNQISDSATAAASQKIENDISIQSPTSALLSNLNLSKLPKAPAPVVGATKKKMKPPASPSRSLSPRYNNNLNNTGTGSGAEENSNTNTVNSKSQAATVAKNDNDINQSNLNTQEGEQQFQNLLLTNQSIITPRSPTPQVEGSDDINEIQAMANTNQIQNQGANQIEISNENDNDNIIIDTNLNLEVLRGPLDVPVETSSATTELLAESQGSGSLNRSGEGATQG